MPIKRRPGKVHVSGDLTETEWAFLRDDPEPAEAAFGEWWSMERDDSCFRADRPNVADMWRKLGAQITAEHAATWPGSRPRCWWKYDAPEARRRLGGVGEPGREDLTRGIPNSWAWPRVWPAGATIVGGPLPCDPADPPVFESEATYLRRLGLLLPGETERLEPADFEPEPIAPRYHLNSSGNT